MKEHLSDYEKNNSREAIMRHTIATILTLALTIGILVSLTGTAAAQNTIPDMIMQADDLGPLFELIVSLFDISISIEG